MKENESVGQSFGEGGETLTFSPVKYRPCGDFVQVMPEQEPGKAGVLHLPGEAMAFEFVPCKALAVGPDCKWVVEGDRILVAAKAIMPVKHEGFIARFTKESSLITRL